MAELLRVTAVWTAFTGAPGYSSFYCEGAGDQPALAQTFHNSVREFFRAMNTLLPNGAVVTVQGAWAAINESSGQVNGEGIVGTQSAAVVGTASVGYAAQAGAAVEWNTGTFENGRRLRGKTYLVPMAGIFEGDGTLLAGKRDVIVDAANALLAAVPTLSVWHRPVNGAGGSHAVVTSITVRDKAVTLRSRQD